MRCWLTVWRNDPDTTWLAETPVQAQQQTLKRLEASYRRFFECEACGHSENADLNAAMKQEPAEGSAAQAVGSVGIPVL